MTAERGSSKVPLGAVCVVGGVVVGVIAALVPPAFFFILVRELLIMGAGVLIGYGTSTFLTDSSPPLTPRVSWVVPVAVFAVVGSVLLYDLFQLGFDAIHVVLKGWQGVHFAAWCGVPLGSALKRRNATMALVSIGGGAAVFAGAILYAPFPSRLFGFLSIGGLVVFGVVAVGLGYRLTGEESRVRPTRTGRAEG